MTETEEVKAIVDETGNSFHSKVASFLREKKWKILVSPYYMDSATDKPREVDIVAQKTWVHKSFARDGYVGVTINLFTECKYVPQPNVFWFDDKDAVSATAWVTGNTPLHKETSFYTARHHYLATNPKVAKLFASGRNKQAAENEPMYKALNQSLNAMIYLRARELFTRDPDQYSPPSLGTVGMPVIVCNSFQKFYRVDMECPGEPEAITDNFQLEVNYAYLDNQAQHRTEYFLIDVVAFDRLDTFLTTVENDVDAMFNRSSRVNGVGP